MSDEAIITKLDELIAATRASAVPIRDRWIDAATAAALLSIAPATFLDTYACRPDFPRPMRVGHPRWRASEILEWCESRRREGLPRRRRAARKNDTVPAHQEVPHVSRANAKK